VSTDKQSKFEHGSMVFDLSSWQNSKTDNKKLHLVDLAIQCNQKITCMYYKPNDLPFNIEVMPIKLVLKVGTWYVHALYKNKREFRYYKLNRMQQIEMLDSYFEVDDELLASVDYYEEWYGFNDNFNVKVRFFKPIYGELDKVMDASEVQWESDYFDYVLHSDVDNWLLSTLLSFREHVYIYDEAVRNKIIELLIKMKELYD
jgi:predicted DNA-binding transcriptional regulator YafY